MMQRGILREFRRRFGRISITLLLAVLMPAGKAADYRFGYSSSYHYPYGVYDNLRLRREIDHLGNQMKRQQRQLDSQIRQTQEQTRLLRQQQAGQLQVTGMQACYYRLDGGLDLCDRLFDAASKRHAACVDTAKEMNSGCAEDSAKPVTASGG